MVCDKCGMREARVSFNVLFPGKKIVRSYCMQCAQSLRRGDALGAQMALINTVEPAENETVLPCPQCGTLYSTVQKTGRMGCAACYRAFSPLTERILQKLNGAEKQQTEAQMTESPVNDQEMRIRALKGELAQAVSMENYERAAVLRDEINALTAQGGNA